MRAAVYLRLSKETDATTSPARQLEACRQAIAARGWEEVAVFEDLDVSAFSGVHRPGLAAARDAFGTIDALVFYRVDRLARSTLEFHRLAEEALAADVALVSATEALDLSTPMGKAMAGIVSIFAELEAATISLRVKDAQRHLASVGRWRGGRRPFGWKPEPHPAGHGYRLARFDEEADVLEEVVGRVLDREPMTAIVEDLNRRGIPTPRGRSWTVPTLRGMLKRPGLLGHSVHDGRVALGDDGRLAEVADPILDRQTFDALQAELARRHSPRGRRRAESLLLSGLAVCGTCGRPLYAVGADATHGDGYRCASYTLPNRRNLCPTPTVASAAMLHRAVEEEFLSTIGHFPVLRLVVPVDEAAEERARLTAALADLEADRYERGAFPGKDGADRFAALHRRLSEALAALPEAADLTPEVVPTGETFAEAWQAADEAGRRGLLGSALQAVEVDRATRPGRSSFEDFRSRVRLVFQDDASA